LVALLVLWAPQAASAHAVLEGTSPGRGAELRHAPKQVAFRFGEPVEAAFGAVQVYDQQGKRVDRGGTFHPGDHGNQVAIGLRSGLGDGTYTATFRVISADSHPVSGGFVFTIGKGGVPAETLDQLIDAGNAGPITKLGFGIVRALSYVALALAAGGIVFVAAVWRPTLRARAGADESWQRASTAFTGRARRLTFGAVALGVAMSVLGILFQGAVAGGTSLWQALDSAVVGDVLGTRFGTVWGLRLLAWLALGGVLAFSTARVRAVAARPAPVAVALLLAFLCLTPALAGHAATTDPSWLLVPANVLHVACMAVWVGGVALLLLALPAATRPLDPAARTGLLAEAVSRFSTLALAAVAGIVASGTLQAIVEIESFSDLLHTAFGRAILIKIALLLGLIGLGAWNRQRIRPRLAAADAAGETPGRTGIELRRSLRAEIVLMAAVLGVTAALVSYAPATATTGPFSTSKTLGPARAELTVDPARAGSNQIHLYLFDRRSGRQYERIKELTLTATLFERRIGPLPLRPEPAGPGHYVVRGAALAPPGRWQLTLSARVSAFDAYTAHVEVPIK
jgi:copper transport protein